MSSPLLDKAIRLAAGAHAGQTEKDGRTLAEKGLRFLKKTFG